AGLVIARRIAMTAMPQLVAAFHSLVGMAAVLVGAAAYLNPEAFGITAQIPYFHSSLTSGCCFTGIARVSRVEMGLGVAIGAITFSGSVIAFLTQDQSPWVFFTVMGLSFAIGFLLIIPIGGADMPVVISMLNSYSGWAAAAMGFTLHNSAM